MLQVELEEKFDKETDEEEYEEMVIFCEELIMELEYRKELKSKQETQHE